MHILFLILKTTGIILLSVLGILILMFLIIFLAPLNYEAKGSCHEGEIRVGLSGSWLFPMLRFRVEYGPENGLRWKAALAWITRSNEEQDECSDEKEERKTDSMEEEEPVIHAMETDSHKKEEKEDVHDPPASKSKKIKKKSGQSDSESGGRFNRIKYTFRRFCDKIKDVKQKKEEITGFLQDEKNQAAFHEIWIQIQYLLKKIVPKKCHVKGILGFEDPAVTGQVFGGISILYAWIGTGFQIIPDFERKIIELDFRVCGKFRLIYLMIAGVKLVIHRDTRRFLIKMIKQFS